MPTTVHVATSSPDGEHSSIGMLEWRLTEQEALDTAQRFRENSSPGDTITIHATDVPDDVYAQGAGAVTEYLVGVVDY